MADHVLVPTIQHTGTWFLLHILESTSMDIVPYNPDWTEKNTAIYAHYPLSTGNGILPQEEVKFISLDALKWVNNKFNNCPLVVPTRDPLAAVITRQQRHPDMPHKYIIDGFLSFAHAFHEFNVLWFPIDLFDRIRDRLKLLTALESHIKRTIKHKHTVATEWTQQNTQGRYALKEAYYKGDIAAIKKAIPCEWEYLVKSQELLQPFFEKLGYTNLAWFKK
jgi:hypothetical protein